MKGGSTGWHLLTVLPLIPGLVWLLANVAGLLVTITERITP